MVEAAAAAAAGASTVETMGTGLRTPRSLALLVLCCVWLSLPLRTEGYFSIRGGPVVKSLLPKPQPPQEQEQPEGLDTSSGNRQNFRAVASALGGEVWKEVLHQKNPLHHHHKVVQLENDESPASSAAAATAAAAAAAAVAAAAAAGDSGRTLASSLIDNFLNLVLGSQKHDNMNLRNRFHHHDGPDVRLPALIVALPQQLQAGQVRCSNSLLHASGVLPTARRRRRRRGGQGVGGGGDTYLCAAALAAVEAAKRVTGFPQSAIASSVDGGAGGGQQWGGGGGAIAEHGPYEGERSALLNDHEHGDDLYEEDDHDYHPFSPHARAAIGFEDSVRLVGELVVPKPGFLKLHNTQEELSPTEIMIKKNSYHGFNPEPGVDMLVVSSFGVMTSGGLTQVDLSSINADVSRSRSSTVTEGNGACQTSRSANPEMVSFGGKLQWPNEVEWVAPRSLKGTPVADFAWAAKGIYLVADGFLCPGKGDGGIYIGHPASKELHRLTSLKKGWFYHKAVWLDLPGGRKAILTARATMPLLGKSKSELVFLEMPTSASTAGTTTTTTTTATSSSSGSRGRAVARLPRMKSSARSGGDKVLKEQDPQAFLSMPWKETVLVEGPDVMFDVTDLDARDDTIEVFCAEFFGERLTLRSLHVGNPAKGVPPSVTRTVVIDDNLGKAYSVRTVNLEPAPREDGSSRPTHLLVTTHEHGQGEGSRDGKLLAYDIPRGSEWKEEPAQQCQGGLCVFSGSEKDAVASAVRERAEAEAAAAAQAAEQSAAPYTSFTTANHGRGRSSNSRSHMGRNNTPLWNRHELAKNFRTKGSLLFQPGSPGFAYPFWPHQSMRVDGYRPYLALSGDCSEAAYIFRPKSEEGELEYELAAVLETKGTVGSLAIGYGPLGTDPTQDDGFARIYMPSYENNRVYVFEMGVCL